MISNDIDYNIFFRFFDQYSQSGLEGINIRDPLMIDLENFLAENRQLFYISDVILFDVLYVSNGVKTMFGKEPGKVHQGFFLTTTHPEDFNRHQLVRSKVVNIGQDLYAQKKGAKILSMNVRARKPDGSYFNALYQAYIFYSKVPYESVFMILVITDITSFKNIHKGFHFHTGDDIRYFRFPDDELLKAGNIFSPTEFEILKLIDEGQSSLEISEKLFRSLYTINTHRANIMKKANKTSIAEVIHELKKNGLL